RRALAATCAVWPNVAGELARSGLLVTAVVRCNPVVCGPDMAPAVTGLKAVTMPGPGTTPGRPTALRCAYALRRRRPGCRLRHRPPFRRPGSRLRCRGGS